MKMSDEDVKRVEEGLVRRVEEDEERVEMDCNYEACMYGVRIGMRIEGGQTRMDINASQPSQDEKVPEIRASTRRYFAGLAAAYWDGRVTRVWIRSVATAHWVLGPLCVLGMFGVCRGVAGLVRCLTGGGLSLGGNWTDADWWRCESRTDGRDDARRRSSGCANGGRYLVVIWRRGGSVE
ncbi:hypothetical protein HDV57DRAFT_11831 [Trichoderma longibrachiatum]|uniref:Uncharacterized protein n=1 Tax=Trichoderma longibrachiatum ATCC 18648 TaxID=983965 RepID=A0A2T4CJ77_TRILO|nr:hypothetical protein M440DRAFT_89267 [Trichoderma longibrachiatum ATCC 18648]